jgi:hypothetical protein
MSQPIKHLISLFLFIIVFSSCLSENKNEKPVNNISDSTTQSPEPEIDTLPLITYGVSLNTSGQLPFKTKALKEAKVKLFPRYKDRKALGINSLSNVYGIHQFFMDHDLTSGFVHEYTANFFNKLPQDGFVMKIERSNKQINEGIIRYVRKKDLEKGDALGQNIAFCRQWKLSEIGLDGFNLMVKKSNYRKDVYCPQLKAGSSNPYNPEIPIWTTAAKEGVNDFRFLNSLTDYDGGTAVIVWETEDKEIRFIDIHGSIADILNTAISIKNTYKTDPTIGIYDAGSFARKFKADINGNIDFNFVNARTGTSEFVGAGYGYLKEE